MFFSKSVLVIEGYFVPLQSKQDLLKPTKSEIYTQLALISYSWNFVFYLLVAPLGWFLVRAFHFEVKWLH